MIDLLIPLKKSFLKKNIILDFVNQLLFKMKTLKTTFLIALAVLFVTSCTVEKRLYNKGFHVEWKKKYKKNKGEDVLQEENYAHYNEEFKPAEINTVSQGEEIASTSDEIQISDNKQRVVTFNNNVQAESTTINIVSNVNTLDEVKDSKAQKQAKKKSKKIQKSEGERESSGGKSQIIALVLVLLVGVLGIHRFYLGHIGIGVLMLLTGGVCGILALIDLIRIITGDLKPKDGEYTETL